MSVFNPLSWFGSRSAAEKKESAVGPIIADWHVGRPVWTPRDYEKLSRESYMVSATANRCVKLIATSSANVQFLLNSGTDSLIDKHPILDLIERSSPMVSRASFLEAVYAYLMLAGNSYIEAVSNTKGEPQELWALRPDRMTVVPGESGMPAGYEYRVSGKTYRWQVDQLRGTSPVMHIKEFHPLNDWYGMSRVEAAAYGIDRHNAASEHNKALLDNGARPSGALIFEPVKTGDSAQAAPEETIAKAEKQLEKRHGGPANAGRPFVFGGNVKWESMGLAPRDMDFALSKDDAARDICTAFGVPHILIVPGEATYNNVREAKLEFYEDTVVPLVERLADELTTWLAPAFGEGLELTCDLDSISALEPRRESRRTSAVTLLKEGVITDEEARQLLQYGPRDANAVRKVDAAVLTALIKGIKATGIMPLARYMRSVGLVPADMTDEAILAMALELVEDEDGDDEDDLVAADDENDDEGDQGNDED